MKTVVGIDYGTLSARAVLVDVQTGQILCTHQVTYPHGVLTGDYADAKDYNDALLELLQAMSASSWRESIKGICVDATSLTMVPLSCNGIPLSLEEECKNEPHAQIKLWKHHTAQPQADEALQLAQEMQEPFLKQTGDSISSEWMLPKLLQCHDEAPEVFTQMDVALDLCEYLTYRLTGKIVRANSVLGFKCLWSQEHGFPTDEYLDRLRPGFARRYKFLLRGQVLCTGEASGYLSKDIAEKLGLNEDIVVATGTLDGHTSLAALGALNEGDATLVIGTSNVLTVQTRQLHEIPGICGVAKDGFIHGLYGYDSGQACTGDMLAWYISNMVPTRVFNAALAQKTSVHDYLCSIITEPWRNSVTTVDWWNGSRNVPCDLSMCGDIRGITLSTAPQDIYLSMLQAIACGTRNIIDQYMQYGIRVKRLIAAGGIAQKNPLLMQEYANILHLPVNVGKITEGPALGAALFAAVAAGIYPDIQTAWQYMGIKDFTIYQPDVLHSEEYEQLYQRNCTLRRSLQRDKTHGSR